MYDPLTVAFEIRSPLKRRSAWFPKGYRKSLVTIWHRDPEADGTDDSCGWFWPPTTATHRTLVDTLVAEELVEHYFSAPAVRESGVQAHPDYAYQHLPPGDAVALTASAWFLIAWRLERRRLTPHDWLAIVSLTTHPNDNIRASLVNPGMSNRENVERFLWCVLRNYLRFRRPWYRHPRWHLHHWSIQIHTIQQLKRWLWSRCAACGERFSYGESPVCTQWESEGPQWFRGETAVYHGACREESRVKETV
jgi:hypothetical protein